MPPVVTAVVDRLRTPGGRKAMRYMAVSAVTVVIGQIALFVLYVAVHWTAISANVGASVIAGVPSYYLHRGWTWKKTGRSHLLKEVVPFWALAFIGLGLSTWAAHAAESWGRDLTDRRLWQAVIINGAVIGAYGVIWVAKFFIFNKLMFVKDEDLRAALADDLVV